jgi:hypothetical protein
MAAKRLRPPWILPVSLVVVVVALLLGCVLVFPKHLVDSDLAGAKTPLTTSARLKATNDVRTTLLQGLAGAFFLATALFTWRQIRISQRQLQLSEEQQIADRFTKAVEQLGKRNLDVQLGGIFALEQVATASPAYPDIVVEVLAAYVREHAPRTVEKDEAPPRLKPDVQAVLTVLGTTLGARYSHKRPINLSQTDLRTVDLRDAVLPGVHLNGSNLRKARLDRAHLERGRLVETDLTGASLEETHLDDSKLIHAKLESARFVATDLTRADLTSATVDEKSRFIRTRVDGATLTNVALDRARYGGLSWNEDTEWPQGFVLRDESPVEAPPAPAAP